MYYRHLHSLTLSFSLIIDKIFTYSKIHPKLPSLCKHVFIWTFILWKKCICLGCSARAFSAVPRVTSLIHRWWDLGSTIWSLLLFFHIKPLYTKQTKHSTTQAGYAGYAVSRLTNHLGHYSNLCIFLNLHLLLKALNSKCHGIYLWDGYQNGVVEMVRL